MKNAFPTACAALCACLLPLPLPADPYVWDNQNGNGIWNDPVNWGLLNTPGYNIEPTAVDVAIFRSGSPAGTVTLINDAFAVRIRQNVSAPARVITINAGELVDRTLTITGTNAELFECTAATANFTLDGTPNTNGARFKLKIDASGTGGTTVNAGVTLTVNCDVSGAGGFILNGGSSGAGRLVLGGNNTYTGPTTVNAGTLLVNGSIAPASAVSVASGATLGGNGVIGGSVSVAANGNLSPGTSVGTLAIAGDLTLSGKLVIEVNKSLSQSNDFVTVSGTLNNTGNGTLTVNNLNPGVPLVPGDTFKLFNKPLSNGGALNIISSSGETWTNKLAVDGSIAVLSPSSNAPPPVGDPTTTFIWNCTSDTDQNWSSDANWVGGVAPKPGTSNIIVFRGDIAVPWNWPNINTNYGTTILIFSNDVRINGIKITAGMNHTMNLGSYVLNDQPADAESPSYFGIDSDIDIPWSQRGGGHIYTTNANFTNALGNASCGGQTDFKCVGARLDVYGVLKDGLGANSKLIKSGEKTLNITGQWPNTYTGGTIVNAGPIKMAKPAGFAAIPGDVTVNGTGSLLDNSLGGEQIAHTAIVTLNDSGGFDLRGQPYTVQTVQGASAGAHITSVNNTLTVAPLSGGTYNGGVGVSDFAGSISGSGTFRMNGTGTFGMLGANSVANLVVNSGTLKVNGNSGTGPVTVTAGGTLLGKGTISGAVTVASGATIAAGFSAGQLTLSAGLDLSAGGNGATNVWELAALKDNTTGMAGTDFDQIVLTGGTLALSAQATLDIRFIGTATAPDAGNPFWQSSHSWTIISMNGGNNPGPSSFGRIKNGHFAAGNFTTAADGGGNIVLTFTPTVVTPASQPTITSIAGAGTGSVAVNYTNTLPGSNYVLSFSTNLGTTNWSTAGNKTATGTSDSQTDNSASTAQRYYRVRIQ